MIEKIKLTPQQWNTKHSLQRTLEHITWILQVNINIIIFKRTRNFYNCTTHTIQTCLLPCYKYQNSIIKLLQIKPLVTVLLYKKTLFVLHKQCLEANLINLHPDPNISYKSVSITDQTILDVINNNPVKLQCNLKLYSTNCYTRAQSIRKISDNIIGSYCYHKQAEILHVFVTPQLMNNSINKTMLLNIKDNTFYKKNLLCSYSHLTEGDKTQYYSKESEEILNQEFCICEHPETNRIFPNSKKMYTSLGM
jgi:hypothetical protein